MANDSRIACFTLAQDGQLTASTKGTLVQIFNNSDGMLLQEETKAMLNSATSPSKRSRLETYMNRETIWLSVFLLTMCGVVALGMGLWLKCHECQLDRLPYYRKTYSVN